MLNNGAGMASGRFTAETNTKALLTVQFLATNVNGKSEGWFDVSTLAGTCDAEVGTLTVTEISTGVKEAYGAALGYWVASAGGKKIPVTVSFKIGLGIDGTVACEVTLTDYYYYAPNTVLYDSGPCNLIQGICSINPS
jgi:hypothetical protein